MKIKKQNQIPVLIAILAVLILGFLWFSQNKGTTPETSQAPAFQSVSDLDNASKQLDSTNLNQMDSGINQVASDASSF